MFLLSFHTLYNRFSIALFLLSAFVIYMSILQNKRNDYILILILILIILRFFFVNFIWYGTVFTTEYNHVLPNHTKKIDMLYKPLYFPTPILLDVETYGYSNTYIYNESMRGARFLEGNIISPAKYN